MKVPLFLSISLAAQVIFAADAPKDFNVGEFTFKVPAKWQWVENTSPMRKAQLKVQDESKSATAEVVFFHFGEGNGGGVKANVDRWLGQFKEPKDKINSKVEDVTVNKRKITYVQADGTYLSGMPGGPKTEQANATLLGAIVESEKGNVFIRMTGPSALVKASRDAFRKMVEDATKG